MKNTKVEAVKHKETSKAVCLSFDYGDRIYKNIWLPKSQIEIVASCPNDYNIDILIPIWLIKKQVVSDYHYGNSNSSWVDVFRKQDANGLTEYGYAI